MYKERDDNWGWENKKEVSFTKYHPDPVEYAMVEKEKIPGRWNSQMVDTNTHCDSGRVEMLRNRRERWFLVDGIVRRTPVKPKMILCQFKASCRGQSWCLLDGIARRRPATPKRTMNLLKTCFKRKRWFLMDETVRGRPAITNMILVP